MVDLDPFPNLKPVVVALLAGWIDADTKTPPDLAAALPFARVTGRGGSDDRITARRLFDVDVFAATEKACDDLAELVAQRLTSSARCVTLDGGLVLVDGGETVTAAQIVPWSSDRDVWRSVGTYALKVRRTGMT